MPEKKVDADTAQEWFLDLYPPKYSVSSKFSGDHQLEAANLSKKTSIEAAIDRYKRNQKITKSSWLLLDEKTVLNKAAGARKKASVYSGAQQMCVELKKITRRTVTIDTLTYKESKRIEHTEIEIKGEKVYLSTSSAEAEVTLCCKGAWEPLKGKIEIYHYDESKFPTKADLLAKYLAWEVDDKGRPIGPVAKK